MATYKSPAPKNALYYGDNLEVLRQKIPTSTVDLCYIDPPFNSQRTYNQIYNNIGAEDRAQAQAFIDTWEWDSQANEGFDQILRHEGARFQSQTIELLKGLQYVLGKGSLLAYLVSMTLRLTEIHRVLKPTGSFYLHCDPTASHYLKLVLDSIFVAGRQGAFLNEIVWHYLKWSIAQRQFVSNHDVILFYSKSADPRRVFNTLFVERSPATKKRFGNARIVSSYDAKGQRQPSQTIGESEGVAMDDVWDISRVPPIKQLYPTEKPTALLDRIIRASTNEGDVVLDAYCGCGTSIFVAEALKRRWIGIDITYQSIAVVLRRLEKEYGSGIIQTIAQDGIPRDMASVRALVTKDEGRGLRKEFEKWSILTYTKNRAIIKDKKGADGGVDGTAYFQTTAADTAKIIFQATSAQKVDRGLVAKLHGDMHREGAVLAILITLSEPTTPAKEEARKVGHYWHELMGRNYNKIELVTVRDMLEKEKRLEIPMSLEVLRTARLKARGGQLPLLGD